MRHFFKRILPNDSKWEKDRVFGSKIHSIANTILHSQYSFTVDAEHVSIAGDKRIEHEANMQHTNRKALNQRELVFLPRHIIGKLYICFIPIFCITTFWEAVVSLARSSANELR